MDGCVSTALSQTLLMCTEDEPIYQKMKTMSYAFIWTNKWISNIAS